MIANKKTVVLIHIFLALVSTTSFGQAPNKGIFFIEGLVSGYFHDPTKKIFQKEKPIVFEGTLKGVTIDVYDEDIPVNTVITNMKGEFELRLHVGSLYKFEFTKNGHAKSVLLIDLKSLSPEISELGINFKGAEFILNSYIPKDTAGLNEPFGKLYYDVRKKMMRFEPNQFRKKTGRQEEETSVTLMKRAVIKNQDNVIMEQRAFQQLEELKNIDRATVQVTAKDTASNRPVNKTTISNFTLTPSTGVENLNENNISVREKEVAEALKQLENDKANAITRQDSLLIEQREMELLFATGEIMAAKKIIKMQHKEIRIKRNFLIATISSGIILMALILLVFIRFREKKKMNAILDSKNKKITDSINYARHIQQSVLPQEDEIKRLLPDLFIYYEPLDIVSGDFYWSSVVDDKIVIAAIDCTGHGVPGAFMSLIGNTLLNEIVNEKRVLKPSSILNFLHVGILKTLHQNMGQINCQDGMEMSLCVIDPEKKIIEYSGAMNPLYVVENNEITVVKPDVQAIGGVRSLTRKSMEITFTDHTISITKNMSLYLFTDGYLDQFGGQNNNKFNVAQFKRLILEIQSKNMDEQKEAIALAMKNWKGNYRQIDDMLVMGVKLSNLF